MADFVGPSVQILKWVKVLIVKILHSNFRGLKSHRAKCTEVSKSITVDSEDVHCPEDGQGNVKSDIHMVGFQVTTDGRRSFPFTATSPPDFNGVFILTVTRSSFVPKRISCHIVKRTNLSTDFGSFIHNKASKRR